ncbi:Reverse transcriptase (fragment) [Hyella patelloides LEGE 07179]|uniref:Reverse transcriptase n=1 Tax=Hyella patelloides LEGE 07179 TaxID=945734 RepID=A0A563W1F4_9CYAN
MKWLKKRYWNTRKGDNWVFSSRKGDNPIELIRHTNIKTNIGHIKVRGDASVFDGNLTYWSTRMGKHPQMPKRTASLIKKQKGKCAHCKLFFREEDVIETDHIIPTAAGGKDEYKNLQLLHRHCHDKKTKSDLKIIDNYQRRKRMEEFYKWFNKLNWIWKEDITTMI